MRIDFGKNAHASPNSVKSIFTFKQSEDSFSMQVQPLRRSSPRLWLMFAASGLVTIALFFFPAVVIRPFAYQAPRALWWAMAIRQRAPMPTLFTSLLCLALGLVLWPTADIWRRIALTITMLLVTFSAGMARINYFEWMFHPVDDVRFQVTEQSKLEAGEMI